MPDKLPLLLRSPKKKNIYDIITIVDTCLASDGNGLSHLLLAKLRGR